jgi:hypothetical protein
MEQWVLWVWRWIVAICLIAIAVKLGGIESGVRWIEKALLRVPNLREP